MIYLIGPEESAIVKIGHTTNQPSFRLTNLQIGNHQRLVVRWAGEGDEALEKHLHAVFKDYRIRGEWFDLTLLGDPVQVVKDEIQKANENLAKGKALLSADRFHDTSPRPELKAFDEIPHEVVWDPEVPPSMRRSRAVFMPMPSHQQDWDERFPPVQSSRSWEDRFPPPVRRATTTEDNIVRRSANGEDPRPGCIRVWKGRCRRPIGTVCDACTEVTS